MEGAKDDTSENDLFATYFRSSLIDLKRFNAQIPKGLQTYAKTMYKDLSITKKIRMKLLAKDNLSNKITKHDIVRACIIANNNDNMINISIQKQKYIINNLLQQYKLSDEITIKQVFDLVDKCKKNKNISPSFPSSITNKNIHYVDKNDHAFVYIIWYAQYISSKGRDLKSSKIQKRKFIKPYWKTKKWREQRMLTLTDGAINWGR
jgi:hypothetical protein